MGIEETFLKMRVSACQISTGPDIGESSEKIIEWIGRASGEDMDIVAFPEATLCGYTCDPSYWEEVDPGEFADAENAIIEASREMDIGLVLGTAHRDGGDWYNDILAIDRGGEVRGRYSKTHLAESWSTPGRVLPIYELAGIKSCFLICHDIRYPELVRLPAISGAQLCYFCSNESGLVSEHKLSAYRAMPIARATENGIFLVMANAPADRDNIASGSQSHGNSKVVHPDGNVLAEAGHFEETLVAATIETRDATRGCAKRSVNDETVLRQWMRLGTRMVEKGKAAADKKPAKPAKPARPAKPKRKAKSRP